MPPPTGIKLRDSCHLCAVSKVKCSKDKPTCARCAERGSFCEYLVTQRTGRKTRRQNSLGGSRQLAADGTASLNFPFFHTPVSPSSPADSASFLPPLDATNIDFSTGLEDSLALLATCPEFCSTTVTSGLDGRQDGTLDCLAGLPFGSDQDMTDHFPVSLSPSDGSTDSLPSNMDLGLDFLAQPKLQSGRREAATSQSLETILRLMSTLAPVKNGSLSSLPTAINTYPSAALKPVSALDDIMQSNKLAIDSIDSMLHSDGVQDGYCLVMIALVVSKILDRYSAAAQTLTVGETAGMSMSSLSGSVGLGQSSVHTPSSSSSGSSTNSSRTDGSRPQRVQMVLGELYHVQSLMDTFSARIDTCVARNHKSLTWSPFSVAVLNSLDTELRKRLSSLSLELIDRLKQHWG